MRLDFEQHAPDYYRRDEPPRPRGHQALDKVDLDHRLRELVRIRASQLNGCAYCIDMHTKDARDLGESEQRIYALPAWREAPFFTDRERAALAFTESVTLLPEAGLPDDVYHEALEHFGEEQLGQLIMAIVVINSWNRIAVSTRIVPGE